VSSQSGSAHAEYSPREKLAAMLIRAEIDEDFANSLRKDPTQLLTRAGLDEAAARELMQQPRDAGPTAALSRGQCFDTTCIVSLCPASCNVSTPAIPGVCTESAGGTIGNIVGIGGAIASLFLRVLSLPPARHRRWGLGHRCRADR